MGSTTSSVGERIAHARGRASLTQADLAGAIQLDRSALAKIETGARRVSALELARISETLGERIEWFLEDAPAPIVSRRNLREPGAPSPAIDTLVERLTRNVEFTLVHDARFSLDSVEPMPCPTSAGAIEVMATRARELLGADPDAPMLDIARSLSAVGLLVFSVDLGVQAADGASILLPSGGIAVVNGRLQVGRRRLTIAHEFGHFLVADEYVVDWPIEGAGGAGSAEALMDQFARCLLLPASGMRDAWESCRGSGDDLRTAVVKIASRFRVDMSTLAHRLAECQLIDPSEARRVRGVKTTKADIVEHDLLLNDELAPPFLSHRYVESVLRLFRIETISAARATDLLLDTWDESDLPELPQLPESAIWAFLNS